MKEITVEGHVYKFPDQATGEQINAFFKKKGVTPPASSEAPKAAAAAPVAPKGQQIPETRAGILSGAMQDLIPGPGGRPGKVSISENRPGNKTPLGVVVNPQNFGESLLQPAITAPLFATPAGWLGRVGVGAGVGAASSAARGGGISDMALNGLIDGMVSALTEGVGGYIANKGAKAAESLVSREAAHDAAKGAYQATTDAPKQALDFLRSRVTPKGKGAGKWVEVPSLSNVKMTADDAINLLSQQTGKAYEIAREEIASSLKKLDTQTLAKIKPYADQVFKTMTSPTRVPPAAPAAATLREQAGRQVAQTAGNPAVRGAADAATTAPTTDKDATPAGAVAAVGAGDYISEALARLLRRVMPVGH